MEAKARLNKLARLRSVRYVQTIPEVFTPGITLQRTSTKNFCKFCRAFIPVRGTSGSKLEVL